MIELSNSDKAFINGLKQEDIPWDRTVTVNGNNGGLKKAVGTVCNSLDCDEVKKELLYLLGESEDQDFYISPLHL